MKWLTLTEIGRRARSKKGALEVSYEHWCQLYQATAKELREEYERTVGLLDSSEYCGLCNHYVKKYGERRKCQYCILQDTLGCGNSLWGNADNALEDWLNKKGDWHTWKRAAKALRDKLKELMQSV